MAWTKTEIEEAQTTLREWLSPGDTVYTVLRHVSRSGMMRAIDLYHIAHDQKRDGLSKTWLSRVAAKACNSSFSEKYEAMRADGGGMDMGFHLVSNLSRVLFPDGFGCTGE